MADDMRNTWWGSVSRFRGSVVLRLLVTVLLFSSAVTLLLTAVQLYGDYHRGVAQIEYRLADIDRSNRDSLAEALWRLDAAQLQLELNGILRLDDIRAVEIHETGKAGTSSHVRAGRRAAGPVIAREFPLVYHVMPEMDGLQLTRNLRRLQGFANVPIVAMSASPSGTDKANSIAAGINVFLSKPVDLEALLTQIAALPGLRWTSAARAPSGRADTSAVSVAALPAQQMDELHRLARLGDMYEIVLWAERMAASDSRYLPFTTQLCALAKGYQSRAILQLVERHMSCEPEP